jgi:hypothetical protein
MMAHGKFTKAYWAEKDDIIDAGVKGWSPLEQVPKLLAEAFPDFRNVKFGFFVKADFQHQTSIGWEFLTKEDFNPDTMNEVLPARFGLEVLADGRLKWRDNYLMFMHKDFRAKVINARNQAHEDKYTASVEGRAYVSPHDPNAAEMAKHSVSKLETQQLSPASAKRGPGRPPKKK